MFRRRFSSKIIKSFIKCSIFGMPQPEQLHFCPTVGTDNGITFNRFRISLPVIHRFYFFYGSAHNSSNICQCCNDCFFYFLKLTWSLNSVIPDSFESLWCYMLNHSFYKHVYANCFSFNFFCFMSLINTTYITAIVIFYSLYRYWWGNNILAKYVASISPQLSNALIVSTYVTKPCDYLLRHV